MRLRIRGRAIPQIEPPQLPTAESVAVDIAPLIPWSVEQLNALRPLTGPSHRTFVPIVRSLQDNSLGDLSNS